MKRCAKDRERAGERDGKSKKRKGSKRPALSDSKNEERGGQSVMDAGGSPGRDGHRSSRSGALMRSVCADGGECFESDDGRNVDGTRIPINLNSLKETFSECAVGSCNRSYVDDKQ